MYGKFIILSVTLHLSLAAVAIWLNTIRKIDKQVQPIIAMAYLPRSKASSDINNSHDNRDVINKITNKVLAKKASNNRHNLPSSTIDQIDVKSSAPIFRDKPELINPEIKVPYPERAKQMMVEGVVRMRLTISQEGKVIDIEMLDGPAFGLRQAARKVAASLSFLPATDQQGNAKIAVIDHEVVFKLDSGS